MRKEYSYEKIVCFKSLYEAHKRARLGKRHKRDVVMVDVNLFEILTKLEEDLINETYRLRGYNKFYVYEPKEREIQSLQYYDRIVQNSLCYNFLVPYLKNRLIYDNAACQKGKGLHFCRKRVEGFLTEFCRKYNGEGYILKMDIRKYFNNIDHEVLKQKLEHIPNEKIKNLVYYIIDSYEYTKGKGVPMGNQSSQAFALYYLDSIDRLIKEKFKIKYYARYMDDLVVIHNDKQYLKNMFEVLKQEVVKLKLEFNAKSQIFPLKQGLEFLGIKYSVTKTGKLVKHMKLESKRRMLKRIQGLTRAYDKKAVDKEYLKMSYAGFYGNIKRMDVNGLKLKYILPLKQLFTGIIKRKNSRLTINRKQNITKDKTTKLIIYKKIGK